MATFHDVVWWQRFNQVTTKKLQSKVFTQLRCFDSRNRFLDLAVTMIDLHIPLKIVIDSTYNDLILLNRGIAVKLLASCS